MEVKIVAGDYLAMENQENVKAGKYYIDIASVMINQYGTDQKSPSSLLYPFIQNRAASPTRWHYQSQV
jgi:hypothetical protein